MVLSPPRLREARHRKRLTQAQLAEQVGVGESSVRGWEAGRSTPRESHLLALAAALDVTPEDLLEEPPTPPERWWLKRIELPLIIVIPTVIAALVLGCVTICTAAGYPCPLIGVLTGV